MSWGRRRFILSGVLVVVLLVAVAWWWIGSGAAVMAEPLTVSCEGSPLPERDSDGPGWGIPAAPAAVAGTPVPGAVKPGRRLDYVPPSQRHQEQVWGYRLDHELATVSYQRGDGESEEPQWSRTLYPGPWSAGATIEPLPGSTDLLQVVAEPQDQDADLLVAAVDAAGQAHLSCVVVGLPPSSQRARATLTPDGGGLLAPTVDAQGGHWIALHATDSGELLWSAPAVAAAADDRLVFLATGSSTLAAREIRSGEVVWEREVDIDYVGPADPPGGFQWELAVVEDELYAYRHGGQTVVAVDAGDGDETWSLDAGSGGTSLMQITQLDDDGRVLVALRDNVAVRDPSSRNWWWLHRGVDVARVLDVVTRSGAPALVAIRGDHERVSVTNDQGELVVDLPLPISDGLAVAETMVYVHRADLTVTGYDLESAEPVWTVPVGTDDEVGIAGISAIEGGFRLLLHNGTYVTFNDE